MRGLKRNATRRREPIRGVASFTDAWIETLFEQCSQQLYRVASFTDAWIETVNDSGHTVTTVSHLLQMRGLKRFMPMMFPIQTKSHLLQMRGLKPGILIPFMAVVTVASFTDAWIETLMVRNLYKQHYVASFTDAWIETSH